MYFSKCISQRGASNSRDQSSSLMYSGRPHNKKFHIFENKDQTFCLKSWLLNEEEDCWRKKPFHHAFYHNQSCSIFDLLIQLQLQIFSFGIMSSRTMVNRKTNNFWNEKAHHNHFQRGTRRVKQGQRKTVVTTRPVCLALAPRQQHVWFNHGGPGNANPDPGHMGQPTKRWARSQGPNVSVLYTCW